jgi:hypothetical protein
MDVVTEVEQQVIEGFRGVDDESPDGDIVAEENDDEHEGGQQGMTFFEVVDCQQEADGCQ